MVDGTKHQDVDTLVGCCSCPVLNTSNAPCHHQLAVLLNFGRHAFENKSVKSHVNPVGKMALYEIATGCKVDLPKRWFSSDNELDTSSDKPIIDNEKCDVLETFDSICSKMKQLIQNSPETFSNVVCNLDKVLNNISEVELIKNIESFSKNLESCTT